MDVRNESRTIEIKVEYKTCLCIDWRIFLLDLDRLWQESSYYNIKSTKKNETGAS